ncbi:4-alpha-glucanotransferase [Aestuariirhabdus litorea]|uniref:4-alpha-glucanotransferase n=1 Tax=Aestuariirhabdus litorea TaxID=2528527 RepID=A0A3P3VJ37_9GAMM|nr:4-alpha-glucanotransferase [Aestuariirhabdus litorea]RRJ82761.1 4-alpha-glucanotransferase [Aestuariirhabdus litorea]RWW92922.1 4-alpha-glucanotransferase [Endozoicomonadaceae bacterium GTF-13]
MSKSSDKPLSTTALAKSVNKEPRELFILLADSGWIEKQGERWRLTPKGEFEGGRYAQSEKYGEYIVWPVALTQHALFKRLPAAPLSASQLGAKLGIGGRLCNLLLAELGWIRSYRKGWQLTEAGALLGGQQRENERSGIPYASWPEAIEENSVLQRRTQQLLGEGEALSVDGRWRALDGHLLSSKEELLIDNWLYLNGVVHSTGHPLPFDGDGLADFYLPAGQLYLEYWGFDKTAAYLKRKLARQALYREHQLPLVEVTPEALDNLDEVLPRALLKQGLVL